MYRAASGWRKGCLGDLEKGMEFVEGDLAILAPASKAFEAKGAEK